MKYIGVILVLAGILLFRYSTTLEPYTNEEEFNEKYLAIEGGNKSRKFYELQKEYRTHKYSYENYALTSIVLGIAIFIIGFNGVNNTTMPKSKTTIVLVGLLAVLMTVFAYVGDLFLEMHRDSYPHWADSLGIPLMGTPGIFIILLLWYFINLNGVWKNIQYGVPVSSFRLNNLSIWYTFLLALTLFITISSTFFGDFWIVSAGICWCYFYFSILIGRRAYNMDKIKLRSAE